SWTVDRSIDDIRLRLHKEVVCTCPAIHFQRCQLDSRVCFHRFQHIVHLICDRLQCSPDNMIFVDSPGNSHDRPSCILIPMWCSKSGKCRNNIASVRILFFFCHIFRICRRINQSHFIPEPLHCCSRDKDGAFKSIIHFSIHSPGNRGNQSVLRKNRFFSRVHQKKASRSICIFRFSCLETGLSKQSGLLISCRSCNPNRSAQK